MVSAYFALKLIRRKRCARQKKRSEQRQSDNANIVKLSSLQSEEKCRICLKLGKIPIYNKNTPELVDQVKTFGDIEIDESDSFPKFLCQVCYSRLQNAVLFRTSAKETEATLCQSQNNIETFESDNISNNDITDYEINNIEKRHYCKLCKQKFKTRDEYTAHVNSKQHRHVRIQCPVCYGLFTAHLYERHLARHQSASHLICEVCGKMYRKDNLIRHLKLHNFELPYHCKVCPYRGRSIESLKIHMRTHTGDKPYSCDKCQLRFLTRCNLSRHLLTHQKERPYKCYECGRGFYIKRDMEIHARSDHAGIKEFGCIMCGNKYGTKKALMRHELRVHKREKMAKGRMPLYLQAEYRKENESL